MKKTIQSLITFGVIFSFAMISLTSCQKEDDNSDEMMTLGLLYLVATTPAVNVSDTAAPTVTGSSAAVTSATSAATSAAGASTTGTTAKEAARLVKEIMTKRALKETAQIPVKEEKTYSYTYSGESFDGTKSCSNGGTAHYSSTSLSGSVTLDYPDTTTATVGSSYDYKTKYDLTISGKVTFTNCQVTGYDYSKASEFGSDPTTWPKKTVILDGSLTLDGTASTDSNSSIAYSSTSSYTYTGSGTGDSSFTATSEDLAVDSGSAMKVNATVKDSYNTTMDITITYTTSSSSSYYSSASYSGTYGSSGTLDISGTAGGDSFNVHLPYSYSKDASELYGTSS